MFEVNNKKHQKIVNDVVSIYKSLVLAQGRKLNIYKEFIRCPGHLLNELCKFSFYIVFKG